MSYHTKEEAPDAPQFRGDTLSNWNMRKIGLYRKLNYDYSEEEAMEIMSEVNTYPLEALFR